MDKERNNQRELTIMWLQNKIKKFITYIIDITIIIELDVDTSESNGEVIC